MFILDEFLLELLLIVIGIILALTGIVAQNVLKRGPARNWSFIICLVAGIAMVVIGVLIWVLRLVLPFILPLLGL